MLKTTFSSSKGFHIPKNDYYLSDEEYPDGEPSSPVISNGFDQLSWKIQGNAASDLSDPEESIYLDHSDGCAYSSSSATCDPRFLSHGSTNCSLDVAEPKRKKEKRVEKKNKRKGNKQQVKTSSADVGKVQILNTLCKQALSCGCSKLLEFYDVTVYQEDVENLRDDEWLNDNNFSFIYELFERFQVPLLSHRSKSYSYEIIASAITLLRPSMVYLLAHSENVEELRGVIPAIDKSSFVFLPLNDNEDLEAAEGGSHWNLVIASLLDRKAYVYDTMEGANEREAKNLVKKLESFLDMPFQIVENLHTPQQINGSDCGILSLEISALILSRLMTVKEMGRINLDLDGVSLSAIDGRIFILGTIVNLMKSKRII